MKFDRLILTGLHKCGKSTFINNICSKNHLLSTIRLDTRNVLANQDYFDINTYFNYFNIYDRFLYIDLFVYYKFDPKMIEIIFKKLKPYFKRSLFVFGMFTFVDDPNNYIYNSEKYASVINILSSLGYNVLIFYNKEDWVNWSEKFDSTNFEYTDKFTQFKCDDTIIPNDLHEFVYNIASYSILFPLIRPLLDEIDIWNIYKTFDYKKYNAIQNGYIIPENISNNEELSKYIEDTYAKKKF